ncbi:MAG: bifunctional diguanylate cyclase/phosphodiesterase [bacterium]
MLDENLNIKKDNNIKLDLLAIVEAFNNNNKSVGTTKATNIAIKDLCDLYNIDRACIITEDSEIGTYLTTFEYKLGESPIDYLQEFNIDINKRPCLINKSIDENKIKFLKLFKNNSFYTSDFLKIKSLLNKMQFYENENENKNKIYTDILDFYVYLIHDDNFFCFITLEKYSNKFESLDLKIINSLLNIIGNNIKAFEHFKRDADEIKMLNLIVQNEQMPIALVEKDTYKILKHNELYKRILPKIKTGIKCHTLYGYDERCPNCYLDGSNTQVQRLESDNHFWIKKSTPVKLSNGTDAYMIYAKDTADYIKQLDGVDILTNLFSLKGFEAYYNETLINTDYNYVLCTIDIDKFKNINNLSGYELGNKVLVRVAQVLVDFAQKHERCCRINEDRFAVFLNYTKIEELHDRILRLKYAFEEMHLKFFSDKKVTIIGGICFVDRTQKLNILMDRANIARKLAKGSHENRFAFYDSKLEQTAENERIIEEKMFAAVTNEEFSPFLQPKFNFDTMEICGAEALVRWTTPEETIYPDVFIPLFEKNGFINILDFIIYKKVMIYMRKCLDKNIDLCPISVNVSRGHVQDKHFTKKFMELVNTYRIPLDLIELEVTESVFVEDKNDLKNFIQKLKDNNLKVSIDDFGTAYSSLQTLKDLNIDILKIDKGFIDNIGVKEQDIETKDEIVIKHIINLAKDLGFGVICEGIETKRQVDILSRLGCRYGQGYLFSKPLSLEEFSNTYYKL